MEPNSGTPRRASGGKAKKKHLPDVSEILPGLYLGNLESALDPAVYERHGISTRISLLTFEPPNWRREPLRALIAPGQGHLFSLPDLPDSDLLAHLDAICDLIEDGLARRDDHKNNAAAAAAPFAEASSFSSSSSSSPPSSSASRRTPTGGGGGGGAVLVHCEAGKSRSASAVVAYLMRKQGRPLRQALGALAAVRPRVLPNPGFREQLAVWEGEHKVLFLW